VSSHEASLIYVIGRVNQGARRRMRERLVEWDLTVQEYTTLSVLKARSGLSNAQLARRALVTPQSMNEILAKLEDRGLLERGADAHDARILRAELTSRGRTLLRSADPPIRAIEDEILAAAPWHDRETALRVLLIAMEKLSTDMHSRAM
jgi:DNA-binding MarR family transcriptional regulator